MSHATTGAGWGQGARPGGDLVTGEAVVVELRLAKLPSRTVAIVLDLTVQVLALVVLSNVLGAVLNGSDAAVVAVTSLLVTVAVVVGYPLVWESLTRGRSLGKLAMGLRVVREDGSAVRFRHSLARALVGVLEIWVTFGVVAVLTSLVSAKGKRAGDYLAGTVVVRERVPHADAAMVLMPPQLAPWAATLDLSRLPDALALAARQLLGRVRDLSPSARTGMATQIAYEVSRYVQPPPPPGCPPEAYLAAVLAERRNRELARMAPPQPYPSQPYPSQPYPSQPYPSQPHPSQPPQPAAPPPPSPPPDGFAAPS